MKPTNYTYIVNLAMLTLLTLNCHSAPPAHVVILIDRSDSVNLSKNQIMGVAEVSMALPGIRKKSLMTIIATGDAATSMEPISIG